MNMRILRKKIESLESMMSSKILSESEEEKKRECFQNKAEFARFFFPHLFYIPFGRHHFEMFSQLPPGTTGKLVAEAAPRGAGKTSLRTVEIIHDIVYADHYRKENFIVQNFVVIIGETDEAAEARVADIMRELESNERILHFFGKFKGSGSWGKTQIETLNGCCVIAKARGSRIRGLLWNGKRPRKIWISDVQKSKHVLNPVQRQRDLEWFQSDVARAGDITGITNIVVEGTILHQDALLANLLINPAYEGEKYQAVKSWATREQLWNEWKTLWTDIRDEKREENARIFFEQNQQEMLEGTQVLWPEGLSYYRCMVIIATDGLYSFLKEMQQEPEDPTKQVLGYDRAQRFRVERDGLLRLTPNREEERLVRWQDFGGVSLFLDWAGGKDALKNCFAGIVVVLWETFPGRQEAYKYVVDVWLDRVPPGQQVAKCFDILEKWIAFVGVSGRMGTEAQVLDDFLAKAFQDEARKRKDEGKPYSFPRAEYVHRSRDKIERIAALEPEIANGWLLFNVSLPREFEDEMRLFPTHEFLDGPDALEGALLMRPHAARQERKAASGREIDQGRTREERHMVQF